MLCKFATILAGLPKDQQKEVAELAGQRKWTKVIRRIEGGASTHAIRSHYGMTGDKCGCKNPILDASPMKAPPRKPRPSHPAGFTPGVHMKGNAGEICERLNPDAGAPDWDHILEGWGLDPALFRVVGDTVEMRSWEANVGDGKIETLHYYKASVVRRIGTYATADIEKYASQIERIPVPERPPVTSGVSAELKLSDWQIGKAEGGGWQATVKRLHAMAQEAYQMLTGYNAMGWPVTKLYITGLGDLVEGTCDFYPDQTYSVELDRREQIKVTWTTLIEIISFLATHPVLRRIVVSAVGGNHGELRNDGAAITGVNDNDDLLVFEVAAAVFEAAGNTAGGCDVEFAIPVGRDSLTATFEIDGIISSNIHGHQADKGRGSKAGAEKVWEWWRDQRAGRVPGVGDADLLWSAHFHHLVIRADGGDDRRNGRIFGLQHIQVPAMDGGSDWYESTRGVRSKPGQVIALVGERWGGFYIPAVIGGLR